MKISRVEVLPVDGGKVHVFVRLHTDDGIVGVGEPSCVGKEHGGYIYTEGCYAYIA